MYLGKTFLRINGFEPKYDINPNIMFKNDMPIFICKDRCSLNYFGIIFKLIIFVQISRTVLLYYNNKFLK